MKINKAYKFRLFPTPEQKNSLAQTAGNCRFLWNYFLNLNQKEYENTGNFIFSHSLITSIPPLKKEYDWLDKAFSQSLQQVGKQFDKALKDFLNKSLKRGFPTWKKKNLLKDSFTVLQKFRISKNYVFIPKIGEVKWNKHKPIKGKVKHITISQAGNLWFCSVNVELNIKKKTQKRENIVGIDVGLKTFATLSDGTSIKNPKIFNKYQKQLKREQRKLSRRKTDSNRKRKQRLVVSRLHRKVKNVRQDFQHKTTHNMITKYDGFILEDLNVSGMLKNHCLAKSVQDASWSSWKNMLRYKSLWNNKVFIEIGRFEPSSKTCCECGWYNPDLTLNDRTFVCEGCGMKRDRDENASINIKNFGMKNVLWDSQEHDGSAVKTFGEIRGSLSSMENLRCLSENRKKEYSGLDKVSSPLLN